MFIRTRVGKLFIPYLIVRLLLTNKQVIYYRLDNIVVQCISSPKAGCFVEADTIRHRINENDSICKPQFQLGRRW